MIVRYLDRVRFLNLLILLYFCFKLLAITQEGPYWEVPTYVFDEGRDVQDVIIFLFLIELMIIVIDAVFKRKLRWKSRFLYVVTLLLCFWMYGYSYNNFIFGLRSSQPFLSMLVSNIMYWGIPLSLLLVTYLTVARIKTIKQLTKKV